MCVKWEHLQDFASVSWKHSFLGSWSCPCSTLDWFEILQDTTSLYKGWQLIFSSSLSFLDSTNGRLWMWMCCEAPTLSPGFGYVPAAGCNTLGIKWGMLEAKFDTSFSLSLTHNTCTIKGFRGNVLPNVSIHFSCFHRSLARNIQFVKPKRHDIATSWIMAWYAMSYSLAVWCKFPHLSKWFEIYISITFLTDTEC